MHKTHILAFLVLASCLIPLPRLHAQSVYHHWAVQVGGPSTAAATNMSASGSNGHVTRVGWFDNAVDLDPGSGSAIVTAAGGSDAYISQLDSNGHHRWGFNLGGSGGDTAHVVATDPAGNIWVAGSFTGSVDFDPGPGTAIHTSAQRGLFFLKLDDGGNLIWARSIPVAGTFGAVITHGITMDAAGNGVFAGLYCGSADFDPGPGQLLLSSPFSTDASWVLKLDSNGDLVWAGQFSGNLNCQLFDVGSDGLGNVFAVGWFEGNVDFDPSSNNFSLTATGLRSAYVVKLDAQGTFQWVKTLAGNGSGDAASALGIAVDAQGAILTAGVFDGAVDFDPGVATFPPNGPLGSFLVKLDGNGNFIWVRDWSVVGSNYQPMPLATDATGAAFVVLWGQATMDLDPGWGTINVLRPGYYSALVKLNANGDFVWGEPVASANGAVYTGRLHIAPGQSIYYSGIFNGKINAGPSGTPDSLTAMGTYEGFLLSWNEDSCASLAAVVDSIADVTCLGTGYALAHASGGTPPFQYLWDTQPASTDSFAAIAGRGLYRLHITDSVGCQRSTSVWVEGPRYINATDLNVGLTARRFRPGLPALPIYLDAFNDGCIPVSGQIRVTLDPLLAFDSASVAPDAIIGDTLVWNFSNLTWGGAAFQSILYCTTSPLAQIGDSICLTVEVTPIVGDVVQENNTKHYCNAVANSYDPNDISVYPPGTCDAGYVKPDQVLTYTIRFQNTGNADAINIQVLDSLGPDLDVTTLKVFASSHQPMVAEVLPGNVLRFSFYGIHLPDSSTNEAQSHGHIVFEITPDSSAAIGTEIRNSAAIYFDLNDPVITNTVLNTLEDSIPALDAGFSDNNGVLQASSATGNYQWFQCDGNPVAINGATQAQYAVTQPGHYQLQVSEGGCIATSGCMYIGTVGMGGDYFPQSLRIYPNPNREGILHIDGNGFRGQVQVDVLDVYGGKVGQYSRHLASPATIELPAVAGLYYVRVMNGQKSLGTFKVVRN